jgi:hypothetical protein
MGWRGEYPEFDSWWERETFSKPALGLIQLL